MRARDQLFDCKRIYVVTNAIPTAKVSDGSVVREESGSQIENRNTKASFFHESLGIGVFPIEDERKKAGKTCRGC